MTTINSQVWRSSFISARVLLLFVTFRHGAPSDKCFLFAIKSLIYPIHSRCYSFPASQQYSWKKQRHGTVLPFPRCQNRKTSVKVWVCSMLWVSRMETLRMKPCLELSACVLTSATGISAFFDVGTNTSTAIGASKR